MRQLLRDATLHERVRKHLNRTIFSTTNEGMLATSRMPDVASCGELTWPMSIFLTLDNAVIFVNNLELLFFAIGAANAHRPHLFSLSLCTASGIWINGALHHKVNTTVVESLSFPFRFLVILFVYDALDGFEVWKSPALNLSLVIVGTYNGKGFIEVSEHQVSYLRAIASDDVADWLECVTVEGPDTLFVHNEEVVTTFRVLQNMSITNG